MSEKIWYLYIVETEKGFLYTGISVDVDRRIEEHRSGRGAKYLRGKGKLEILRTWKIGTMSKALKTEIAVKKLSKISKLKMVQSGLLPEIS